MHFATRDRVTEAGRLNVHSDHPKLHHPTAPTVVGTPTKGMIAPLGIPRVAHAPSWVIGGRCVGHEVKIDDHITVAVIVAVANLESMGPNTSLCMLSQKTTFTTIYLMSSNH